ncbi:MAG: hypothetical protein U0R26_05400 [Solirubrobacterales bacterium]
MVFLLGLAALSCLLGLVARPPAKYTGGNGEQLLDLIRVVATTALAIALLMGPGILWRTVSGRRQGLAFVPLPGLLLLIATGLLAWVLAGPVEPRITCFAIFAPAIGLMLGALIGAGEESLLDPDEQRALLVVGCALGFAIGRTLWSLGPAGELFSGTISRTLEVGDRSDSRIPFIIPQLVAHGNGPYSQIAAEYLFPYNFSSRGPLPGLATTPVVLLSGGRPPVGFAEEPWAPFDPAGFMAFRLAMMTFASTAFLSIWDLVRRIGGRQAARVALLLATTTPFLVQEVWFTWPKLLGASLVTLSGICIVERRAFRSGLLVGLGYLMHPGALLSLIGVGLVALWPLKGADWRRPQLKAALLLVAGVAISLIAWRLVNGSHYSQSDFVEYFREAGVADPHPALSDWLAYRADSLGNTLVPMLLPLFYAKCFTINVVEGISPGTSPFSIHFFFQYWNGLPFGVGIVFFPLLLVALWRAWRLWPWPVFATVIAPFVAFTLYWGASRTGMLREGLQWWVLVLLAAVALQQRHAGFPWLRSTPVRAILALRAAELLAIAVGPALATGHGLVGGDFKLTDLVALAAMLGFGSCLAWLVWSSTPERLGETASGPPWSPSAEPSSPGSRRD